MDETLCTLRYAAKTGSIRNLAHSNKAYLHTFVNEDGELCQVPWMLQPQGLGMSHAEMEQRQRELELEWRQKLDEAERLKHKEIEELKLSYLALCERETGAQNCCLVNLTEDPSLSEKLVYSLKDTR
jgi:hypothetical protein